MKIDIEEVKKKARDELYEDKFREAVEKEKEKLRLHVPLINKIFPWRIVFIRRGE